MSTVRATSFNPLLLRVEYLDAAGGYGGWFILNVVGGNGIVGDSDSNPDNGLSGAAAQENSNSPERLAMFALVHARLTAMFGVGHSATWTGNFLHSITPAVIDTVFP